MENEKMSDEKILWFIKSLLELDEEKKKQVEEMLNQAQQGKTEVLNNG